ncbi:MAG: PH domain-containing protein, partial [Caldilineae bacterium]
DPEAVFRNVKHPEQVHEIMRRAMLDARRRFRYSVQEEM